MTSRVTCVVGATASGKSAVADLVAERLGTSVISVDAMQVYRGMDIGTAKTPVAARRVPLLMVDVVDVTEDYSVQRFQHDARAYADDLVAHGRIPVLCGGTGLYLDAVIDEMTFPTGMRGTKTREQYERLATTIGPRGLWELLRDRDEASAALIHPNNVRRVVRALELSDEGVSYAENHKGLLDRAPHYDATLWGLSWDRQVLYRRIERRVDEMFEGGLVDEVRALLGRGLADNSTASQAIGYKEVMTALDGRCSMEEAREEIKARSRRYAKRQLSWLRRDGRVRWIDMGTTSAEEAVDLIVESALEESMR